MRRVSDGGNQQWRLHKTQRENSFSNTHSMRMSLFVISSVGSSSNVAQEYCLLN